MGRDDAGGQHAHAEATQSADQVLGQHGQAFLQAVVAGQADFELLKRLDVAVVARHQVRADFVLQAGRRRAAWGFASCRRSSSWLPETIMPEYMSSRTATVPAKSAHCC